ncbi:MAG: Gfo/Idh/MocA family oxidoreductase, partial [Chloroflexi bacterium]|nr:Gfo/Idh/MocA family oxidoreductase [Chloroflexota bacterium]
MSEVLRVGVVGCGNVTTRFHLPAYLELPERVRVVAVADVEPARIAEARALPGMAGAEAHADWRELVARPDVDVVDVAT